MVVPGRWNIYRRGSRLHRGSADASTAVAAFGRGEASSSATDKPPGT